jgi:hypothetical protein
LGPKSGVWEVPPSSQFASLTKFCFAFFFASYACHPSLSVADRFLAALQACPGPDGPLLSAEAGPDI